MPDSTGYDFIGDIHGHAEQLEQLLEMLEWRRSGGTWKQAGRMVVFLGDYIDRGPSIMRSLEIVRSMAESGDAIALMGNHEYNAIAWHTRRPDGQWFRPHEPSRMRQHVTTMQQLSDEQLVDTIDWFRTLPFYMDTPGFRAVHATWDPGSVAVIDGLLQRCGSVNQEFLARSQATATPESRAVSLLLKGREITLPGKAPYIDRFGTRRRGIRTRWYESPAGRTYGDYQVPSIIRPRLPALPVPDEAVSSTTVYSMKEKPVFMGHYWLDPEHGPAPLASNVACLDYSVALGGILCGYRWDGEQRLERGRFRWVPGPVMEQLKESAASTWQARD